MAGAGQGGVVNRYGAQLDRVDAELGPIGDDLPPEGSAVSPELLCRVRDYLTRYIVFPSEHEPVAVALWTVHAWMVEQFETSPILGVTSAEMRSGKTLVLDCLQPIVPRPFRSVTPSEATVFFVLDQRPRRTMLLDEADAIFGPRADGSRYEGLRAILNSGNRQGTPVPRVKMEGRKRELEEFDIFGPKVIAGIGKLPDTVTDRCIPIRMKRRAPQERVARFRRRVVEQDAIPIREWLETLEPVAESAEVSVPDELNDRAADGWEPLLAIADAAGGAWPILARLAAIALSSDDAGDLSIGIRLLADVRDVFAAEAVDHLATGDLLDALHHVEDGPWADWYGKPLTSRGLAKLLAPYRVRPLQRRLDGKSEPIRGYFAADFEDAWSRYLPTGQPGTSGTSGTDADAVPDVPDVPGPEGAITGWIDPESVEGRYLLIIGEELGEQR
jgi:hypothetical protein